MTEAAPMSITIPVMSGLKLREAAKKVILLVDSPLRGVVQ